MQAPLSRFQRSLLQWYDRNRRDLPWRVAILPEARRARVDPYHVLVSELMLQQTQVATVIPYFERFIARFPTVADLAGADEQDVLRLWQGLGYYSRARNLHRAAKKVVADFSGRLPETVEALRTLPGVGRYTAGAVASIAFGRRAPILDGNVTRVLCRLDRFESDPRIPATLEVLWARAAEILPTRRAGDFNSALMELGALICTPRAPQCLLCPVRAHCEAFEAGVQEKIPPPKKAKPSPLLKRWVFCIGRDGRWLIEQRPAKGRWAGMWQFVTVGAGTGSPTAAVGERLTVEVGKLRSLGSVTHALTHRRYQFEAFTCEAGSEEIKLSDTPRRWVTMEQLGDFPLPGPHVKIAGMLIS